MTHKRFFHTDALPTAARACHDTRLSPLLPSTYHFVSVNKVHFPTATLYTQISFLITIDLSWSFVPQSLFEDAGICLGYYHLCICPLWEQGDEGIVYS
jgi:hypothetical protein